VLKCLLQTLLKLCSRNDTQRAMGLVKQTATFARKERFSHVVLGCTHLSEVAALFEEEGLPVYDPLAQYWGTLSLIMMRGLEQILSS